MFYLWQVGVWKREGRKKFLVKVGMSSIRYNATRLQLIRLLVPGQDNETRARNLEGSVHHSFWKLLLDQHTQWHSDTAPHANDYITWLQKHTSALKTLFWNVKFLLVFKTGNNVHMLSGTHELECLIMSPAAVAKMSFSISVAFLSDSFTVTF